MSRQKVGTAAFLLEVCPACRLFRRGGRPPPLTPTPCLLRPCHQRPGKARRGKPQSARCFCLVSGDPFKTILPGFKKWGYSTAIFKMDHQQGPCVAVHRLSMFAEPGWARRGRESWKNWGGAVGTTVLIRSNRAHLLSSLLADPAASTMTKCTAALLGLLRRCLYRPHPGAPRGIPGVGRAWRGERA